MSNQHSADESSETITRRKFTLSEQLDREIEKLASRHYQGNVSLCLRAGVKEHQQTLNGEGRLALKRLEHEVSNLSESVADLNCDTGDTTTENKEVRDERGLDISPSVGAHQLDVAQELLDEFLRSETPLRVEDLVERTDLPIRRVVRGLGHLVDSGSIVETPSGSRYQLVANNPNQTIDQYHD
ncbi:hypothetical protein [Halorientalis salina]|uniref:hypothetical protein n=1 Tax=Halorientalis salina TaxID=2932266 RepID=UPI0010AD41CE|nr:hypothetical protein [Halorientalis salina]